jgi:acid phosphatase (class A)
MLDCMLGSGSMRVTDRYSEPIHWHKDKDMKYCSILFLVLVYVSFNSGCTSFGSQPSSVPETRPGFLAGYLAPEALPDSLVLLPPPPAAGSAALAFDEKVSQEMLALHGTQRWTLATEDANLVFPEAAGTFSCALKAPITEKDTPHLYLLLRRTLADASLSADKAKRKYSRTRPFVVNGKPSCTPDDEYYLERVGSYPSGHSAIGWAWALILSEIAPELTDAILARGLAFGESRVVCNVHWQSDVIEGRIMGAGTVARLHAVPAFRSDLEAARAELAANRDKGLKPQRDCASETAAMAR